MSSVPPARIAVPGSRGRPGGFVERCGAGVGERPHPPRPASSAAAACTAATICGYELQRQMLPLIHSRISSGEPAWPSRMQATAEIVWPGVQNPHWNASCR